MKWIERVLGFLTRSSTEQGQQAEPDLHDPVAPGMHCVDFIFGEVPSGAVRSASWDFAHRLPPAFLPGYSLVGRFVADRPAGSIAVACGLETSTRDFPQFPLLELILFPQSPSDDPECYWNELESSLESVYDRLLKARIEASDQACDAAILRLVRLKSAAQLDEWQAGQLLFLEKARIFSDFGGSPRGLNSRCYLRLEDLRQTRTICLVPKDAGAELRKVRRLPGVHYVLSSPEMESLCALYDLARDRQREQAVLGTLEEALTDRSLIGRAERKQSTAIAFVPDPEANSSFLRFSDRKQIVLSVDLATRRLYGKTAENGETAEIPFDQLTRVDLQEDTILGDTKRFRYLYIALADQHRTLLYHSVSREYYEFPEDTDETTEEQLRSLPALLDFDHARTADAYAAGEVREARLQAWRESWGQGKDWLPPLENLTQQDAERRANAPSPTIAPADHDLASVKLSGVTVTMGPAQVERVLGKPGGQRKHSRIWAYAENLVVAFDNADTISVMVSEDLELQGRHYRPGQALRDVVAALGVGDAHLMPNENGGYKFALRGGELAVVTTEDECIRWFVMTPKAR